VAQAYEKILPPETIPSYFIFFEVDPANIDVNIHPTKTEIKFEDEQAIWQILHAAVRESLGKFNIVPSIDFNTEVAFEIPVINRRTEFTAPEININPAFNPFEQDQSGTNGRYVSSLNRDNQLNWEKLYKDFESEGKEEIPNFQHQMEGFDKTESQPGFFVQLKGRYILTSVKSGLMLIDQKRAHERILFEEFMMALSNQKIIAQRELFPQTIELPQEDHEFIMSILEPVNALGFEIRDAGNNSISIHCFPSELENPDPERLVKELVSTFRDEHSDLQQQLQDKIASAVAKASSINYGKQLQREEMQLLTDRLFACENPSYSPDGKSILFIMSMEDIARKLL
jgi:DNA mismatch repair protein MutL